MHRLNHTPFEIGSPDTPGMLPPSIAVLPFALRKRRAVALATFASSGVSTNSSSVIGVCMLVPLRSATPGPGVPSCTLGYVPLRNCVSTSCMPRCVTFLSITPSGRLHFSRLRMVRSLSTLLSPMNAIARSTPARTCHGSATPVIWTSNGSELVCFLHPFDLISLIPFSVLLIFVRMFPDCHISHVTLRLGPVLITRSQSSFLDCSSPMKRSHLCCWSSVHR